jgi:hypothetical protein
MYLMKMEIAKLLIPALISLSLRPKYSPRHAVYYMLIYKYVHLSEYEAKFCPLVKQNENGFMYIIKVLRLNGCRNFAKSLCSYFPCEFAITFFALLCRPTSLICVSLYGIRVYA